MVFSSIPFLYYFLPAVFILYFAVPFKFKNTVLMAVSLFFYGYGGVSYLFLMLASIVSGYVCGRLMGICKEKNKKKIILVFGIIIISFFLAYFKYADFFISNVNTALGVNIPLLHIALPIGISFYTFQVLSYVVDVYRGDAGVQKNFINFAAYVSMFPQLIAGPIVRYTDVEKELRTRTHSVEKAYMGARRFIVGLSKKILIADTMYEVVNIFKDADEKTVVFYWLYSVSYALYVYFDFSGYSDMAIGIGHILGFNFPENFNYPYLSKSVTEFWRRWHMTLGSWFRDYIYIPLGGNRVKMPRWILNIAVVWAFTGLWHGAAWNFVLWGVLFAVLLVCEKFFLSAFLKRIPKVFSHIYVMLIVVISFTLFDAKTLSEAITNISGLFGLRGVPFIDEVTLFTLKNFLVFGIIAIIGSTPVIKICAEKLRTSSRTHALSLVIEPIFMVILLLVCTAFLVDGSFSPFLYFTF